MANNYLNSLKIEDFGGLNFICDCGEIHYVATKKIFFGEGKISKLRLVISEIIKVGKIAIISKEDIFEKWGKMIREEIGYDYGVVTYLFENGFKPTLERVGDLMNLPEDTRVVIAFGDDSVADISKYFTTLKDIKLIIIPDSPSSDTFLNLTSNIYVDGNRKSFKVDAPYSIICDTNIITACASQKITSGMGCMLGKFLDILDYRMEIIIENKKMCEFLYDYIHNAITIFLNAINVKTAEIAVDKLMLILLKFSIFNQITQKSQGGSVDKMSRILEYFDDDKTLVYSGERQGVAFFSILKLYKLFFQNINNLEPFFINLNSHTEKMSKLTRLSELEIMENIETISIDSLDLELEYLRKYSRDLNLELDNILIIEEVLSKFFYMKNSSLKNRYSEEKIKEAVYLAGDIDNNFAIINIIRDMGLLENLS